ncbi:NPCBM/NEW2 domain-containing protein [Rhodopirellula sp. SWK7]|uniref:NPCBM/NEW2 domain-containing protein n=1 Tax=Rhodopirellula sp. SWK7 TaxID=595460 RepID=UPI0002BE5535|nr:NPCBM/NEW2 domain-containing protein [Rhodopirellula sp. SWK7]EMI42002.1 dienelactone hydrolase domain protein [Rhodopirellula sp. SWK7]
MRVYLLTAFIALAWVLYVDAEDQRTEGSASFDTQIESLPPLKNRQSPQTVEEAWAGYDPQAESLDVEVIKEWEKERVVLRAVRYRIGIFKGQKYWMGALYCFPKGAMNLPAIVQIHGGGGIASEKMCVDNAKRGYATISLNWRADDRYLKTYDLPETAQTDWGAVEGRQVNGTRDVKSESDEHFDPVPSARNNGYFLRTLAARRALTFLQQQSEVDRDRLGVDGFSMGGVITFMTAAMDDRVKAAVPWWAPPLLLDGSLKGRTASANACAKHIQCPTLIMAPSNDFHGKVEDVAWMIDHMSSKDVRIARSVHFNHKNDARSMAAREMWLDAKLKEGCSFPAQPEIRIDFNATDQRPEVTVIVDNSMPVAHVDIFYTRDGKVSGYPELRTRYWQYAKPQRQGETYLASLDLFDVDEPLWVFANVYYVLENFGETRAITQASETFTVTTRLVALSAETLADAGIRKQSKTTEVIESFGEDWEKEWVVTVRKWESHKLNQARVPMPQYGKLVLDLQSDTDNSVTVEVGDYRGVFNLEGGTVTQRIEIFPFDLKERKSASPLLNWSALKRPMIGLATHRGMPEPSFKKFAWQTIAEAEFMDNRPFQVGDAEKVNGDVNLTFALADHIEGRFDSEGKSVKVQESNSAVDVNIGLQVHSHSELTYFLNGKFSTFSATLIPCFQASVTFEVHADGKRVFESESSVGKTQPEEIQVNVSGTQLLKLVVTDGGNGWAGDWVTWGKPSLR